MNILATIPKYKFDKWEILERILKSCDGADYDQDVWLINLPKKPLKLDEDSVCFMVYDGLIRGYFYIIAIEPAVNWFHYNQRREGYSIIMCNWHPISNGEAMKGFQGWRYTSKQIF